jgi:hypothetical protein
LEKLVEGQHNCRVEFLEEDDPEREHWPRERSRLLPKLRADEPVLVKRSHGAVAGGWPDPDPTGCINRAALEDICFFDGERIALGDPAITGWLVSANDTVRAH